MSKLLRIGTRDSQLAVWQATWVQDLLAKSGVASELVYMKSEGDLDTVTPLYALGVQGVFTKTLDTALLNHRIDLAVHSMKDVPTQLAQGLQQAAVLKRASYKDILVLHPDNKSKDALFLKNFNLHAEDGSWNDDPNDPSREQASADKMKKAVIATSSIRRIAQWLHRYPNHSIENLRGNVNTRLRKLTESNWQGAIFAAAGLERIHLRPEHSIDLDWMLPAPAQGAIMVVCRTEDAPALSACAALNDETTARCTQIEKDFLRTLMGGCSTPISALAVQENKQIHFKGNICAPDGSDKVDIAVQKNIEDSNNLGEEAAQQLLQDPRAQRIIQMVRHGKA